MTQKMIKNAQLGLILSCASVGVSHANVNEVPPAHHANPVSAEACLGLSLNSERLSCYDAFFRAAANTTAASSAQQTNESISDDGAAKHKTEAVPISTRSNLFTMDDDGVTRNASLLDRRWELSPNSKLGTWNIRAYEPVYLLPVFWTSKKNEDPHSANPVNTVTPEEARPLTSNEAKFQISLKTKAVENVFGSNGDVWLGYTQSSRWQVYNGDDSRPFRETNYEPEASLIFRTNYEVLGLQGRLLGLTLNHQSNGKSDPWSRSWNRVMLNVGLEKDNFVLMLRPWYRIKEDAKDDNNPDILNYVGRGDLLAFYEWNDHDFSLMLRHTLKGGENNRGAAQFDWAFPISGRLRGHFQLFSGYGESLIDYNHKATYLGLGISLMNWY